MFTASCPPGRYGGAMANGVMLCATTHGTSVTAPRVPKGMRHHIAPPREYTVRRAAYKKKANKRERLPDEIWSLLRPVRPYKLSEVQRALEFYALTGTRASRVPLLATAHEATALESCSRCRRGGMVLCAVCECGARGPSLHMCPPSHACVHRRRPRPKPPPGGAAAQRGACAKGRAHVGWSGR